MTASDRNPFIVVCGDPALRALVGVPRASRCGPEWICEVEGPGLFVGRKKLAGVDARQARELAILFARTMLIAAGVDGDTIEIEDLQAD